MKVGRVPYVYLLLQNRNVMALWLGRGISLFGDMLQSVALPLFVYQTTGSGLALSSIVLAETIPSVFAGPIAGALVDQWDKKLTMAASAAIHGLLVLLIPLFPSLPTVWVVGALSAIVSAFFGPAWFSLLPRLVNRHQLSEANSLFSATEAVASTVGAGVAGFLVTIIGLNTLFYLNSVSFFAVVLAALALTVPAQAESSSADTGEGLSLIALTFSGVREIIEVRLVRDVSLVLILRLLSIGMLHVVLVVYALQVLGLQAAGYGLLLSVIFAGSLVGSICVGMITLRSGSEPLLLVRCTVMAGLAVVGLASTGLLPLAFVCAAGIGLTGAIIEVMTDTTLQAFVSKETVGRVFGTLTTVLILANLVSVSMGGILIDLIGIRLTLLLAGLGLVTAGIYGWLRLR